MAARANLPAASLSYAFLRPLGGALRSDAGWACQCVGLWPPVPALDHGQVAWVDGFAETLAPFALDAPRGPEASERWPAVKRRCDPRGVFGGP